MGGIGYMHVVGMGPIAPEKPAPPCRRGIEGPARAAMDNTGGPGQIDNLLKQITNYCLSTFSAFVRATSVLDRAHSGIRHLRFPDMIERWLCEREREVYLCG
jgi:hypothetical protein